MNWLVQPTNRQTKESKEEKTMKKEARLTWTCVAIVAAMSVAWLFHGCGGGGGGGTTPSAATESAALPVFTNNSGATVQETKATTPSSSLTIPAGTPLENVQNGVTTRVPGNANLLLNYYPAIGNVGKSLPPCAQAVYGGFAIIDPLGKVTQFGGSGAVAEIQLKNVPSDVPYVDAWSWNLVTGTWQYEGRFHFDIGKKIRCIVRRILCFVFGFCPTGVTGGGIGGLGGGF
jgi:hypothetical protein